MTIAQTDGISRKPLRLWPAVALGVLIVLVRFVLPFVAPEAEFFGMEASIVGLLGGLVGALLVLVWWLFFSRARWTERLGGIAVMILAVFAIRPLTHVSIQNGMMGNMFVIYAVPPTLSLALIGWAIASRRLSGRPRFLGMVSAILIGCGVWTLARTNGILGQGAADLEWRWTPTAEERLLAQAADEPMVPPAAEPASEATGEVPAPKTEPAAPATSERGATATAPAKTERPVTATAPAKSGPGVTATAPARGERTTATGPATSERTTATGPATSERTLTRVEWPGFRGPNRDDVVRGVRIATDWSTSPPVEMWRRKIGPGWSSFAVSGDLLYTQEQRGDHEIVACYRVSTGKPVWMHRDAARFWESNGGTGPRGTPTLSNGRVYSLGATGIVNVLDARSGSVVWSRNASADTGVKIPGWGFTASPLVVGDVVVVATSGALAAYDTDTGAPRWSRKSGGGSYSSPHLVTVNGVAQILLMGGGGLVSVAPADGSLLWEHAWKGIPIVQPAQIAGGDFLVTTADAMGGLGIRRISAAQGPGGWTVEERWTSRGLKPYFNDYVVHEGHAFGFDGSILSCIDLSNGERKWKGGRYGNGQLVLLPDQDAMLVVSEEGELALVSATPDKFTELGRFPVLDSKTWNHPVLVRDVLLVRNGEEMAAFRLPLAGR